VSNDDHDDRPPHETPPPADDREGGRFGFMSDLLRRTFYAGLGAVFTTEEGIRKIASEMHLPKDVATALINQASSTKNELFRIVAKEIRGFLENLNLSQELQRLLTQLSFEIKTEIRFVPNDEALVKPEIKRSVSVRGPGDRERDERSPKT
jgi:hypothetical protein